MTKYAIHPVPSSFTGWPTRRYTRFVVVNTYNNNAPVLPASSQTVALRNAKRLNENGTRTIVPKRP